MKKILFILFAFIITLSATAQESSYREDALDLLSLNGTTEQYRNAIDQLFELLQRQYKSNNVDQATWDELRDASSGEIDRIKAMLVSAYRGTYTQDDIKNMVSFYQTEAGQQLLKDQAGLTDGQRNDVSFFYNTDTGKKILSSKDKISRSVGEVSEIWSRDLYKMMIDKLAEKGHTMQQ